MLKRGGSYDCADSIRHATMPIETPSNAIVHGAAKQTLRVVAGALALSRALAWRAWPRQPRARARAVTALAWIAVIALCLYLGAAEPLGCH